MWTALSIAVSFGGCGTAKKIDADTTMKREHVEDEGTKGTYLDDYKIVDLNRDKSSVEYNRGTGDPYGQAISDLSRAIDLNPNSAEAYIGRGKAHVDGGEHEKAMADFAKAIDLNPNSAEAYIGRGNAHADGGEHERAMADFAKAIDLKAALPDFSLGSGNPLGSGSKFAVFYYNRGNDLAKRNRYEKAILAYDKAIELNSILAEAFNNRGTAYYSQSESENLIPVDSEDGEPNSMDKFFLFEGDLDHGKYQSDQAISDFTRAIDLNEEYAEAYYNRGTAYSEYGQLTPAISDFNRAIEINGEYAEAYFNRGNAYASKSQYEQAIADYTKTIEITPKSTEAYNNRGKALMLKSADEVRACSDWAMACDLGDCGIFKLGKSAGFCQ